MFRALFLSSILLVLASCQFPRIAYLSTGEYAVAWLPQNCGIQGYIANPEGNILYSNLNFVSGACTDFDMIGLPSGGFMLVWIGGNQIYAQSFTSTGTASSQAVHIDTTTGIN